MKLIKRIILLLIIVIAITGGVLAYKGHKIYKDVLEKTSVADKVTQIKSQENYTELKDLPDFYKNAVIAVEDRRFYKHGPIDPIAIARAVFVNIKSWELQ